MPEVLPPSGFRELVGTQHESAGSSSGEKRAATVSRVLRNTAAAVEGFSRCISSVQNGVCSLASCPDLQDQ